MKNQKWTGVDNKFPQLFLNILVLVRIRISIIVWKSWTYRIVTFLTKYTENNCRCFDTFVVLVTNFKSYQYVSLHFCSNSYCKSWIVPVCFPTQNSRNYNCKFSHCSCSITWFLSCHFSWNIITASELHQ